MAASAPRLLSPRMLGALAFPLALLSPVNASADEPCQAHAAQTDASASHPSGSGGSGPCRRHGDRPCATEGECPVGCAHCASDADCADCAECGSCDGCSDCADDDCACPGCADRVAIDVYAGLQLISRHTRYTDDVYGAMRRYELPAGPAFTLGARWFPGAHFTRGVGSAFGVDLRFDRSFGITTDRAGLVEYDTVQRVIEVSAVARHVGRNHELAGGVGFGSHAFSLRNATPATPDLDTAPDVPNVDYRYLRLGLDARYLPFDFLGFGFGAAALVVFDAGGLDDSVWFPRADVGGLALSAKVLVPLPHSLELRAGLEYRRFFYSMNAQLGDPVIVGGGLDQYTAAEITVAYRH